MDSFIQCQIPRPGIRNGRKSFFPVCLRPIAKGLHRKISRIVKARIARVSPVVMQAIVVPVTARELPRRTRVTVPQTCVRPGHLAQSPIARIVIVKESLPKRNRIVQVDNARPSPRVIKAIVPNFVASD